MENQGSFLHIVAEIFKGEYIDFADSYASEVIYILFPLLSTSKNQNLSFFLLTNKYLKGGAMYL